MGRIEKTVFISYRRTNYWTALAIFQNLNANGYDVFFDYKSIPSGDFEQAIIENIKSRAHFILVLSQSALERCNEPGDWLRREMETAIDNQRNIIPLIMEGFDFGSPSTLKALTGKLDAFKKYNGLGIPAEYFDEAMAKLRSERFLNKPLELVSHPVSDITKQITEEQKSGASEAALIEKEELTAQEWFERGYIFDDSKNYDEAIRCLTEAIRLKDDFVVAFTLRGIARRNTGDLEGAITDFDEAIFRGTGVISHDTENAIAYNNRGVARFLKGDVDGAIEDYGEAIRLKPHSTTDFKNRGYALQLKGNLDDAISDFDKAIDLKLKDASIYVSRGNIRNERGNIEGAIADFSEAISIEPSNADAFYCRGRARTNKGDLVGALEDYTEAIRVKSDFANAYWGRGNIYWQQKDYLSASIDYQNYFDLGGNDENVKHYLDEAKKNSNK